MSTPPDPKAARRRAAVRCGLLPIFLAPLVALVALATVGATAGAAASSEASDLAAVRARGKLTMLCFPVQGSAFVAADLDAMRDQKLKLADLRRPDQFQGADVELMQGFARQLGVQLEVLPVAAGYAGLLPALLARQGDLVASELTVTPKRLALVAFSEPYVTNWLAVIARRRSRLASPADLDNKKAAIVAGSSHEEFLLQAAPGVKLAPTTFDLESLEAVESRRADFTLRDSNDPPGTPLGALHPDLEVAFRLRQFGDAVALRKGSDLLAPLNRYLATQKSSGDLANLLRRHGIKPAP
jgi:polar amino acid transport system substrate-binding protein